MDLQNRNTLPLFVNPGIPPALADRADPTSVTSTGTGSGIMGSAPLRTSSGMPTSVTIDTSSGGGAASTSVSPVTTLTGTVLSGTSTTLSGSKTGTGTSTSATATKSGATNAETMSVRMIVVWVVFNVLCLTAL